MAVASTLTAEVRTPAKMVGMASGRRTWRTIWLLAHAHAARGVHDLAVHLRVPT